LHQSDSRTNEVEEVGRRSEFSKTCGSSKEGQNNFFLVFIMAGELTTLKELLVLNRFFIGAATLWAFILAFIAATNNPLQILCPSLESFAIFAMAFGCVAAFGDCLYEYWQDYVYTIRKTSDGEYYTRGKLNSDAVKQSLKDADVPDEFTGIFLILYKSWTFCVPTKGNSSPAKRTRACTCLFLLSAIRFAGNCIMFMFYVLATTNQYATTKFPPGLLSPGFPNATTCSQVVPVYTWINNNNTLNGFFWTMISLVFFRVLFAVSYPIRKSDPQAVKLVGMNATISGSNEEIIWKLSGETMPALSAPPSDFKSLSESIDKLNRTVTGLSNDIIGLARTSTPPLASAPLLAKDEKGKEEQYLTLSHVTASEARLAQMQATEAKQRAAAAEKQAKVTQERLDDLLKTLVGKNLLDAPTTLHPKPQIVDEAAPVEAVVAGATPPSARNKVPAMEEETIHDADKTKQQEERQ